MTPEERYLFDLNGFLMIRGALNNELLSLINRTIDEIETLSDEEADARGAPRSYSSNDLYAQVGEPSHDQLRDYHAPVLSYGSPFEELIDCPTTIGHIDEMIGEPCRLDAASFMSRGGQGAFRFHHGYAELLPYSEYLFQDNKFQCVSVKIAYALNDVGIHDGCFAVMPGSHKSNFTNPLVGQIPDPDHPLVEPLACRAGDAILFSEDLSHGAVENHSGAIRRTLFYSYAPRFHCQWSNLAKPAKGFRERATQRQRELIFGEILES